MAQDPEAAARDIVAEAEARDQAEGTLSAEPRAELGGCVPGLLPAGERGRRLAQAAQSLAKEGVPADQGPTAPPEEKPASRPPPRHPSADASGFGAWPSAGAGAPTPPTPTAA